MLLFTTSKLKELENTENLSLLTSHKRDVQNLIQSISSSGYENMQSLAGQLSGRAWGEMLCKMVNDSDYENE